MSPTGDPDLRARYGAARGLAHQRFFENPTETVSYFMLNTARPLFADARLRRAVNFAVDRSALAAEQGAKGPQRPTDQYLRARACPAFATGGSTRSRPDLARARRLAGPGHHHANLLICDDAPCRQRAQIVRANLAKIGIDVHIQELPFRRSSRAKGSPAPTGTSRSSAGAPTSPIPRTSSTSCYEAAIDPRHPTYNFSHFNDPAYNRRLDAAARLSGPARYAAYARLDADLASKAAPMIAFGVPLDRDLFSARIGCQIYQPIYGIDLAALCIRHA